MKKMETELKALIAEALKCEIKSITPNSGLGKHHKWDSLGHVAIMVALEKKYGIVVDDSNINQLSSFTDIINYLNAK